MRRDAVTKAVRMARVQWKYEVSPAVMRLSAPQIFSLQREQ